jgi:predicted DNA-binding transcriptional regulator YafY
MPTKYDRHRITRQWTLILLLIRHRYGLTLARLAELLHISRITLWRDLKALGDAGLPLEDDVSGGEKRIRLRTSDLPALILSPLQVQALELSRRLLGPLEGTALLDAYDEILLRVGRTPRRGAVGAEGGGSPEGAAAHRRALESALAARRRVRLTYLNVGEAEARSREVEPLGWRFVKGELYLVAYDLQRRGERSFASHRIRAVEALAEAAERTASGEETGYFSAGEMLESLPGYDVVIDLSAVAFAHLPTRPLCAGQQIEARADGGARLTARIAGLWSAADWVIGWGGEARIVNPPEFAELVRGRARATLAALDG